MHSYHQFQGAIFNSLISVACELCLIYDHSSQITALQAPTFLRPPVAHQQNTKFTSCLEAPGELERHSPGASRSFQELQEARPRHQSCFWASGAPESDWKPLKIEFPGVQELPGTPPNIPGNIRNFRVLLMQMHRRDRQWKRVWTGTECPGACLGPHPPPTLSRFRTPQNCLPVHSNYNHHPVNASLLM